MATEDLVYRNAAAGGNTSPTPDKSVNPSFLPNLSALHQETMSALGEANQKLNSLGFYDPEEQPPTADTKNMVEAVRPISSELEHEARVLRGQAWALMRRLVQLG